MRKERAMISFEEAYRLMMNSVREVGSETVSLDRAMGRILAEDIRSDTDMPPFTRSAMDGYACRKEDLENELTVIETIPAGCVPKKTINVNQCAKIMTGSMVPDGADCVIMVEFTEQMGDFTIRFTGESTSENIRHKAEDLQKGDVVLRKGTRIREQHIAVLATVGCASPLVSKQPRVGIIATGDELVEPSEKPEGSQIRNSNSYQLHAQALRMGVVPTYCGIASDDPESLDAIIKKAIAENDVVILSGGVSMGDYDLVPGLLKENGIELLFEKVAIKPGKPTVFGVGKSVFCFGLPGNPVSTFVTFEQFVKPFLYRMMGCDFRPLTVPMRLEKAISRKKSVRRLSIPVVFTDTGGVVKAAYHGSAHINAYCDADGILTIPTGISEIKEGTIVDVRPI